MIVVVAVCLGDTRVCIDNSLWQTNKGPGAVSAGSPHKVTRAYKRAWYKNTITRIGMNNDSIDDQQMKSG